MPSPLIQSAATSLADFTAPSLMVPQLRGPDAASVLQELAQALHRAGRIKDLLAFYHAATNMESLHSSAMDYGIAFPHARVRDVDKVCLALGRSQLPIAWRDGGEVRNINLVFLMALPADEGGDYIPVVLSVAHLHTDPDVMRQLLNADTAEGMFAALQRVSLNPALPARRGMPPG